MMLSNHEITERLKEARDAMHALNLGQNAVEIRDSNGDSIRYTPANASRLKQYIYELEAMLKGQTSRVMRPVVPVWN